MLSSKDGMPTEALAKVVEAAGVEPEAGVASISFYADLPNVYRMKDI